jgi:hypothetical protein
MRVALFLSKNSQAIIDKSPSLPLDLTGCLVLLMALGDVHYLSTTKQNGLQRRFPGRRRSGLQRERL